MLTLIKNYLVRFLCLIIVILVGLFLYKNSYAISQRNRAETAESALDNTVDATLMEIDEHKSGKRQIEARCANEIKEVNFKIANKCKKIVRNMPQRFIDDGTCEIQ